MLLSSRPAKGMWVANCETANTVTKTLKFRLLQSQNTNLLQKYPLRGEKVNLKDVQFSKLFRFGKYVISWNENTVILFDPSDEGVLEWHSDVNLIQLVVYHNLIYLLHLNNEGVPLVYVIESYNPNDYLKTLILRIKNDSNLQIDEKNFYWTYYANMCVLHGNLDVMVLKEIAANLPEGHDDDTKLALLPVREKIGELLNTANEIYERDRKEEEERRRVQEEEERRRRIEIERLEDEKRRKEEEEIIRQREEGERQRRIKEEQMREEKRIQMEIEEQKRKIREEKTKKRKEEKLRLKQEKEAREKLERERKEREEYELAMKEVGVSTKITTKVPTITTTPSVDISNDTNRKIIDDINDGDIIAVAASDAEILAVERPKKSKRRKRKPTSTRIVEIESPNAATNNKKKTRIIDPPILTAPEPINKSYSPQFDIGNGGNGDFNHYANYSAEIDIPNNYNNNNNINNNNNNHKTENISPSSLLNDLLQNMDKTNYSNVGVAPSSSPKSPDSPLSLENLLSQFSKNSSESSNHSPDKINNNNNNNLSSTSNNNQLVRKLSYDESPPFKLDNIKEENNKESYTSSDDNLRQTFTRKDSDPKNADVIIDLKSVKNSSQLKITKQIYEMLEKKAFKESNQNYRDKPNSSTIDLSLLRGWIETFNADDHQHTPKLWLIRIITTCFELDIYPAEIFENYSSINEDCALNFLEKYKIFLNLQKVFYKLSQRKYQKCIEFLFNLENNAKSEGDSELIKRYETILSIDEILSRNDISSAIQFLISKNDTGFILRFVSKILQISPALSTSFCLQVYPNLLPWSVYLTFEEYFTKIVNENEEEDKARKALLEYSIIHMYRQPESRQDTEIIHKWIEQCLRYKTPQKKKLFKANGHFIKKAHMLKWEYSDNILSIIQQPNKYSYDIQYVKNLCRSYGFIHGVLHLSILLNEFHSVIDIVIQTDDLNSFNQLTSQQLMGYKDWAYILRKWLEVNNDDNINNEKENKEEEEANITKQEIASKMLTSIGCTDTLKILTEISSFGNELPSYIFKDLLKVGRIGLHQDNLLPQMLEIINLYLWKQKPNHLAPQMRYIMDLENGGNGTDGLLSASATNNQSASIPDYSSFDNNIPLPKFYEDLTTYWGVQTKLAQGNCPSCTLPLREYVGTNIVIFRCGHGYHQQCIPENACRVCVNIPSLLNW